MILGRRRRADGWLIMFTATWYGGFRLLEDFAREAPTYLGLRGTQWVSVALIVGGGASLVWLARRKTPASDVIAPAIAADEQEARMLDEGAPVVAEAPPIAPESPPEDERSAQMIDEGGPLSC